MSSVFFILSISTSHETATWNLDYIKKSMKKKFLEDKSLRHYSQFSRDNLKFYSTEKKFEKFKCTYAYLYEPLIYPTFVFRYDEEISGEIDVGKFGQMGLGAFQELCSGMGLNPPPIITGSVLIIENEKEKFSKIRDGNKEKIFFHENNNEFELCLCQDLFLLRTPKNEQLMKTVYFEIFNALSLYHLFIKQKLAAKDPSDKDYELAIFKDSDKYMQKLWDMKMFLETSYVGVIFPEFIGRICNRISDGFTRWGDLITRNIEKVLKSIHVVESFILVLSYVLVGEVLMRLLEIEFNQVTPQYFLVFTVSFIVIIKFVKALKFLI